MLYSLRSDGRIKDGYLVSEYRRKTRREKILQQQRLYDNLSKLAGRPSPLHRLSTFP